MGSTPVVSIFVQPVHVPQNPVQVGLKPLTSASVKLQVGQIRHVADFLLGDLHAIAFLRADL